MSNLLSEFTQWCDAQNPLINKELDFFVHNGAVCIATNAAKQQLEDSHRPCHHIGLPITTKNNKLLPAAIDVIGPYLPTMEVTEQAARMASYGKDVLLESLTSEAAPHEQILAVTHNNHRVAIGQMVTDSNRAIRILVDVGRFLHQKS